jgi:NADH-quinone oxidoreductase subunit A
VDSGASPESGELRLKSHVSLTLPWVALAFGATGETVHIVPGLVMRQAYIGIAILLVVGLLNAGLFLALSHLASVRRPTAIKASAYESGIDPLGDTRDRFSVKFYIVAILFIVFDIETIFFLPWAAIFRELGLFGLIEMFVFVLVLGAGLAYAWKKGALEWE